MSELNEANKELLAQVEAGNQIVFDLGAGATICICGCVFNNGLYKPDGVISADNLLRYHQATPGLFQFVSVYDASNPEHNRSMRVANTDHIVQGIQTTAHLAKRQSAGIDTVLEQAAATNTLNELLAGQEQELATAGIFDITSIQTAQPSETNAKISAAQELLKTHKK